MRGGSKVPDKLVELVQAACGEHKRYNLAVANGGAPEAMALVKEKLTAAYQKLFNKVIIPQIKTGLAATVYTQVTDVEDEINGLMTYDRQVAKIDPAVLQKINEKVKY